MARGDPSPKKGVLDLPDDLLAAAFLAAGPEALPALRLTCTGFLRPANSAVQRLQLRRVQGVNLAAYMSVRELDASAAADVTEAWLATLDRQAPLLEGLKLRRHQALTSAGAAALGRLPCLQRLDLSGAAALSDAPLRQLAPLRATLHSLSLRECGQLTDGGLAALLGSLPLLQEADLGMCSQLGDEALCQLAAGCPHLTKLDLTSCEGFSEAGLRQLARLPLHTLLLSACCQLTDGCLAAVGEGMPGLRCLGLFEGGESVTDGGLAHLARLASSLTALDLGYSCWAHTPQGLAALLSQLTGLQMLNIGGCEGSSNMVMSALAQSCRQLTRLDVSECQRVTAAGVCQLAKLPRLQELNLGWNIRLRAEALEGLVSALAGCPAPAPPAATADTVTTPTTFTATAMATSASSAATSAATAATTAGAASAAGPTTAAAPASTTAAPAGPALTKLDLSFCAELTDKALAHAAQLPHLTSCTLRKCAAITDKGLHWLAACTSLQHLDLSYCCITSYGLSTLRALPALSSLTLVACIRAVHPPAMRLLAELPALRMVDLSDNKRLDDGCMQALSHVSQLRSITLNCCPRMSDRGLLALSRIAHLSQLSIERCPQISPGAVARLQHRLVLLRVAQPADS